MRNKIMSFPRKRMIFSIIILFFIIVGIIGFSYAFFSMKIEKSGTLNVVAGEFSFQLTSSELNNRVITVAPNSQKSFPLEIENINSRDSSYAVYYNMKSPIVVPSGVKVLASSNSPNPATDELISKGQKKTIDIIVENNSTSSITIEFGVQGGIVGKELQVTQGQLVIDVKETSEACFSFLNGKITGYYDNQGNNSANPVCPRDVIIPKTIGGVQVTSIGSSSFEEKQIIGVSIPDSVTVIGDAAFKCNQLTNIKFPSSITRIEPYAFDDNQLTSVVIPSSITNISEAAFYRNHLTSIVIPSTVTVIGEYAFGMNLLTNIVIPNSILEIKNDAFSSNRLTEVRIPNSVKVLGDYAFAFNQLTNVKIVGKANSSAFSTYGTNLWGWANGYSEANIIWNA